MAKKSSSKKKSTSSSSSKKSSSNSPRTTKRKKQKRSPFKLALKWIFVLGLWCAIILGGLIAWYAAELPDITKNATFERQSSIRVLAADGSEIARYGEIKGLSIKVEDVPETLKYAVLAIEDRRFYSHPGVDPLGIARAMVTNIMKGGVVQGGSTITQQLAKNLFLSRKQTLKRKIQEAMLAIWLEHELSKDEILSAYLNRVYLGSGTYGVDAASKLYFSKDVKDLTLRESAIIAGLLKAPSRYSPRRNSALANERADVVLAAMVDAGYITEDQIKGETDKTPKPDIKPDQINADRYFTDWVIDGIDDLIGTPDKDLVVQTTLVPQIQNQAQQALNKHLEENAEEKKVSQGAVVVMGHDGAILAMMGGRNYNESQFNRITQAKRQPGSSFKPFVYLTALENGWRPDSQIIDEPITEGSYKPDNFGNKYYGLVNLQTALTNSLNTVSVRLMEEVGRQNVVETARRLGIISTMKPDLSLALGTASISPLELTTAYAVIANGGFAVFPYGIKRITDEDGKQYYQRPEETRTRRLVNRGVIYDLQSMMRSVVENGTGRRALQSFPAAGKTGTSQDYRDAWFAGYTDRLVSTVWLGNDDNTPMNGVTGGSIPAAIWGDVIRGSQDVYRTEATFALANKDDRGQYYNEEQESSFSGLLGRIFSGESRQERDTRSVDRRITTPAERQGSNDNNSGWEPIEAAPDAHESNARYND